jgi:hypothetical protein
MIQPTLVTIVDAYQTCSCGGLLLAGDTALQMGEGVEATWMHQSCYERNPRPEWKLLRRVDAYRATNPVQDEKYWEQMLLPVTGNEYPRESSFEVPCDEHGDIIDIGEPTGQRWNGNNLQDCREALRAASVRADLPRKAKLMVEIANAQILRAERANLYRHDISPSQLAYDRDQKVYQPFVDFDDTTNVGKDTGLYVGENGRIADSLPSEWTQED